MDKHRFVAYATTAIKNSVKHLIRVSNRRDGAEGPGALTLDGILENTLQSDMEEIDAMIMSKEYTGKLKAAIKNLMLDEKELVDYVYFKKHSLKKYSELKGIPYSTMLNKKNSILKKLRKAMSLQEYSNYLN